jgi:hypothetical protein
MNIPILGRGKAVSRIMICVPSRGTMPTGFVHDFTMLVTHSTRALDQLPNAELLFTFCKGTYIDSQRNDLVAAALKTDVAATLWLDDDMRFPRDALLRLMKRRKPFVGVNYPTRTLECVPTSLTKIGTAEVVGERLMPDDQDGLVEVEALGFGVTLIHIDVFKSVPYPWFECYYDKGRRGRVGEDVDFCEKARKAGFPPFVDRELSRRVGHIGEFEYTLEHAKAYAEEFGGKG